MGKCIGIRDVLGPLAIEEFLTQTLIHESKSCPRRKCAFNCIKSSHSTYMFAFL